MKGGVRFYIAGTVVLLTLAGCGRGFLQYGQERAAWRHQAEATCMKSGAVKIGAGVVQIQSIDGPGMCGADFPLKVAALGESPLVSYADELRPPGAVPNVSSAQMPQWPLNEPRYAPPAPVQNQPGQQMRWTPGPPGIERPEATAPARYAPAREPASRPMSIYAPGVSQPDDIPDDAILPSGRAAPRTQPAYNAPVYRPPEPQQQRAPPPLGPMRGPQTTASIMPAAVTPPATLACPLVSALERWVSEGVQPAALRWFGAQVAEIKQISAYSCRGMVGSGSSSISEHAFGNALDVAGFVLADGRKILVKDGWHGTPEEQGFLHDVQLYACDMFSTVLAPGYNAAHYDHIHVDLMRRTSGRHPCRPEAIPGEVAAAQARSVFANRQRGPTYTGSMAAKIAKPGKLLAAVPGDDGDDEDEDGDEAATGPILKAPARSYTAPSGDAAFRADERRSKVY